MAKQGGQQNQPEPLLLEVDGSQQNVLDPAPGIKLESTTPSILSSPSDALSENGRTYHKYSQGNYDLPIDDQEQNRLDLQHYLFSLTFDGHLSLAPINNPQRVLDLGTGTGMWAMEYALQNPSAIVIGSDLSPIQHKSIPPNCYFTVADAEKEWTYHEPFNYIHGRALFSCFVSPLSVFRAAFSALSPGGYLEMQEVYFRPHSFDNSIAGTTLESWNSKLISGAKMLGKDWWCTPKYKRWFEEAGFMDVEEKIFYWPGNTWSKGEKQKEMGMTMLANSIKGSSAVSMAVLTRAFGMSAEEVEKSLVDVKRDMEDLSIHTYYPVYVVYGRKPF